MRKIIVPAARWSADGTQHKYAVVIGRHQIVTNGHLAVHRQALGWARRLIILVGSASESPKPYNPFLYAEREAMIRAALTADENARVDIYPLHDTPYNKQRWLAQVDSVVRRAVERYEPYHEEDVVLAGCRKDGPTAGYLNDLRQWKLVDITQQWNISATDVREEYFDTFGRPSKTPDGMAMDLMAGKFDQWVPRGVGMWLAGYVQTGKYLWMAEAFKVAREYRAKHDPREPDGSLPKGKHHKNNMCGDAAFFCSGKIALVKRKFMPGRGLWALPGGHCHEDEYLLDCAERELNEETRLVDTLGETRVRSCWRASDFFDAPHRSSLGVRTYSVCQAYELDLKPGEDYPKLIPQDDAEEAAWFTVDDLPGEILFDDHKHIIVRMRDLLPKQRH